MLLTTSYRWTCSFTVHTTLSTVSSSTSSNTPASYASFVATTLASDDYTSTVSADVGAAVDTSSIVVVESTRNPSSVPTGTSKGGSDDAGLSAASISGIVIAVVVFVLVASFGLYRFIKYRTKESDMSSATPEYEFGALNPFIQNGFNRGSDNVIHTDISNFSDNDAALNPKQGTAHKAAARTSRTSEQGTINETAAPKPEQAALVNTAAPSPETAAPKPEQAALDNTAAPPTRFTNI